MEKSIKESIALLEKCYRSGFKTPLFFWGDPGIGKTAIPHAVARRVNVECRVISVADATPSDLKGYPLLTSDELFKFIPMSEFPRDGEGILYLDELNLANPVVMALAQRLLLARRIGEYVLPDGWLVCASGNTAENRAAVYEMPQPVANRLCHVTATPVFSEWKEYVLEEGLDGEPIREDVLGFLNFATHHFHTSSGQTMDKAFPTPRSWGSVNSALHRDLDELIPGLVGIGAAGEFEVYREIKRDLPDIEAIMSGKRVNPLTGNAKPQLLYACMSALTIRSLASDNLVKNSINSVKWLARHGKDDFTMTFLTELRNSPRFISNVGEFTRVGMKDSEIKPLIKELASYL